jgi:hypothetical protein
MGLGGVLLFFAVVGLVLAAAGGAVLRAVATRLTHPAFGDRRSIITAATYLPLLSLGWAALVFAFQAVVNERVFQRDPGIGDEWKCPLPNGYALLMIDDEPYVGWVYNPKTHPDIIAYGNEPDIVFGARQIQVAGRYIAASIDRNSRKRFGESEDIDRWILMDTANGTGVRFSSIADLRKAMEPLGIPLNLEPLARVYARYRWTWFDRLVGALLLAPPLVALAFLGVWIARSRR